MSQTDLLIVVFTLGILAFAIPYGSFRSDCFARYFIGLQRIYELGRYRPKFMVLAPRRRKVLTDHLRS